MDKTFDRKLEPETRTETRQETKDRNSLLIFSFFTATVKLSFYDPPAGNLLNFSSLCWSEQKIKRLNRKRKKNVKRVFENLYFEKNLKNFSSSFKNNVLTGCC